MGKAKWVLETTYAEIEAALQRARLEPEPPRIVEANYERRLDLFVLKISDGRRLVLPREDLQALEGSTPEQAADFNLQPPGGPYGYRIWWPQVDAGYRLESLLEGRTGNNGGMAGLRREPVAA